MAYVYNSKNVSGFQPDLDGPEYYYVDQAGRKMLVQDYDKGTDKAQRAHHIGTWFIKSGSTLCYALTDIAVNDAFSEGVNYEVRELTATLEDMARQIKHLDWTLKNGLHVTVDGHSLLIDTPSDAEQIVIAAQPQDADVNVGETAVFSVEAQGSYVEDGIEGVCDLIYQWMGYISSRKRWEKIGDNDDTLEITVSEATPYGKVKCLLINTVTCAAKETRAAELNIQAPIEEPIEE